MEVKSNDCLLAVSEFKNKYLSTTVNSLNSQFLGPGIFRELGIQKLQVCMSLATPKVANSLNISLNSRYNPRSMYNHY